MTVTTAEDVVRLLVANERVHNLGRKLISCGDELLKVLCAMPELAPEMEAVGERIDEAVEHVVSAQAVLKAQIAVIRETAA